jgi:hypothetical protein
MPTAPACPAPFRAHSVARACLAALQGGQAGASPNQNQDDQAGTGLLNLLHQNRHLTGE